MPLSRMPLRIMMFSRITVVRMTVSTIMLIKITLDRMTIETCSACLPLPFTSTHPSLIFVGKARSLPLELSPMRGFNLVGSSLACEY